jgi:hypothetical protein
MRNIWIIIIAIACGSILFGCAGYSISHNGNGEGYDVYRPEPYLLVKSSSKGRTAEIIWLPNYSERYRIDSWNIFGKADFQFVIEDGWKLTKISDKSDNTAVPSKLVNVLEKATESGTIALTGEDQLFRLVYNKKGEFIKMVYVPVLNGGEK